MNTHKIKINFKINAILAGDSDVINSEITKQEIIEILLKKNINMRNKLLIKQLTVGEKGPWIFFCVFV